MMTTALTLFAVLIACMFLATMGAAILNAKEEEDEAREIARRRSRLLY